MKYLISKRMPFVIEYLIRISNTKDYLIRKKDIMSQTKLLAYPNLRYGFVLVPSLRSIRKITLIIALKAAELKIHASLVTLFSQLYTVGTYPLPKCLVYINLRHKVSQHITSSYIFPDGQFTTEKAFKKLPRPSLFKNYGGLL